MPVLSETRIAELLDPYLGRMNAVDRKGGEEVAVADLPLLYSSTARYLDLLVSWNARTNLTAIRTPEEMVQRHFGESFFAGLMLADSLRDGASVLDFGSGAGFPGLPVQLLLPGIRAVLAESQGKKAAFLREAVRVLGVDATVWPRRVEEMQAGLAFDAVALRGVDHVNRMLPIALGRVRVGGALVQFITGGAPEEGWAERIPGLANGWVVVSRPAV